MPSKKLLSGNWRKHVEYGLRDSMNQNCIDAYSDDIRAYDAKPETCFAQGRISDTTTEPMRPTQISSNHKVLIKYGRNHNGE